VVTATSAGIRSPAPRGPARGRIAFLRDGARHHPRALFAGTAVALVALVVVAVGVGTIAIAPETTVAIVLRRLLGIDLGVAWTDATEAIVWELRVPRVLTAATVGAGLAVAGAAFQGLLRNPLADPYVLGTASGAALGAAIALLIPVRIVVVEFGLVHAFAFVGALVSITVVYRLSRMSAWGGMTNLLLTGYAVGALLAAGLAMAMYLSGATLRQIFAFLLGGFEAATWTQLAVALPLVTLGSAGILWRAKTLNGLMLGEEAAAHLGIDVPRERAILLALGSLVTAAAVAIGGLIGFVGLVVPHVVRLVVGPNARSVLPLSIVAGAALLVAADLGARVLGDLPVGVVSAIVGAPFFLFLLRRAQSGYEL
jgi:iron complex transport system permease protein